MILLDAHVHVYPFYDLSRFLDAAVANMPLPSPSDHRVLALAEHHDCHRFERGVEEATISIEAMKTAIPLTPVIPFIPSFPQGLLP